MVGVSGAVAEWLCNLRFWPMVRILDNLIVSGDETIVSSVGLVLLRYWSHRTTHPKEELHHTFLETTRAIRKADNLLDACEDLRITQRSLAKLRQKARSRCVQAMQKSGCNLAVDGGRSLPNYLSNAFLAETSSIITQESLRLLDSLRSEIPTRFSMSPLYQAFSTDIDGYSLKTLFQRCEYFSPTIMFIKTTAGHVFGAFLSNPWAERKSSRYFGNGESFVFSLLPSFNVYPWVGNASDSQDSNAGTSMDSPDAAIDDAPPAISSLLHFSTVIAMAILPNPSEQIRRATSMSVSGGRVRRSDSLYNSEGSVFGSASPMSVQSLDVNGTETVARRRSSYRSPSPRNSRSASTGSSRRRSLFGKSLRHQSSDSDIDLNVANSDVRARKETPKGGRRRSSFGNLHRKMSLSRRSSSSNLQQTVYETEAGTEQPCSSQGGAIPQSFMHATNTKISIGGGSQGHALELDGDLCKGTSFASEIFGVNFSPTNVHPHQHTWRHRQARCYYTYPPFVFC